MFLGGWEEEPRGTEHEECGTTGHWEYGRLECMRLGRLERDRRLEVRARREGEGRSEEGLRTARLDSRLGHLPVLEGLDTGSERPVP